MVVLIGVFEIIVFKFKGVYFINEMVYSNDVQIGNFSGMSVYFGFIGGIFGLLWWLLCEGELLIRKNMFISFFGDEVKKILEMMCMVINFVLVS